MTVSTPRGKRTPTPRPRPWTVHGPAQFRPAGDGGGTSLSPYQVEPGWAQLVDRLARVLSRSRPGSFVIVEYDKAVPWDPKPYAQCAHEVDGWYCEVVSETYLPRQTWPIDELALRRGGWCRPDELTANWWREADSAQAAAQSVVEGLRAGRLCADPEAFSCRGGTFPSDPDGGEPLPVHSLEWAVAA